MRPVKVPYNKKNTVRLSRRQRRQNNNSFRAADWSSLPHLIHTAHCSPVTLSSMSLIFAGSVNIIPHSLHSKPGAFSSNSLWHPNSSAMSATVQIVLLVWIVSSLGQHWTFMAHQDLPLTKCSVGRRKAQPSQSAIGRPLMYFTGSMSLPAGIIGGPNGTILSLLIIPLSVSP
jgi:hypothetical protein